MTENDLVAMLARQLYQTEDKLRKVRDIAEAIKEGSKSLTEAKKSSIDILNILDMFEELV